jgi:hypothetical protein
MSYPPEPWYLGGSLLAAAFLVPAADLPSCLLASVPDDAHPFRVGRRVLIGTAFANYTPGGVLSYDELLVAVPSLQRGRLRITIPQIWVDSAESMEGGRTLWGIPKELATFERSETPDAATTSMTVSGAEAVSVMASYGSTIVPGVRQLRLPIVQRTAAGSILSHNRVAGRISSLSAQWSFDSRGELGYLAGRRPFASFAVREASIVFGMKVDRS